MALFISATTELTARNMNAYRAQGRILFDTVEGDYRDQLEPHLKSTSQAEHQVQRGLLLNVVVRQRAAIL